MLYSKILTIYFELHVHGGMNAHMRVSTLGGPKRESPLETGVESDSTVMWVLGPGLRSSARAEPSLQPMLVIF